MSEEQSSFRVVSTEDLKPTNKRKAPAQIILDKLGGDYLTMRQMAERVGVHVETMRRLTKAVDKHGRKKVHAPSQAVQAGDMTIYLFTPDDVSEIEEYFKKKGYVINT